MSTAFQDSTGYTWELRFTMRTVRELHEVLGIELGELLKDGFAKLIELLDDPLKYFSALALVLDASLEDQGLSGEDFAERFDGDAYVDSQHAFVEALANFYPRHRRKALKTMMATSERMAQLVIDRGIRKIDDLTDDELEQFGNMVWNFQASSDAGDNSKTSR